jgi:TonB family protein
MEGRGQLSPLSGGNSAGLWRMVAGSAFAHVGVVAVALGIAQLTVRFAPPPQNVLMTKIVRLGTPRPKEYLPRKEEPPPPAPPPPPAAVAPQTPVPPASPTPVPKSAPAVGSPVHDNGPTAQDRITQMNKSQSALERLKQKVDGQADGAVDGDSDEAQLGNIYATEVQKCIKSHFVVEGISQDLVVGRKALVLVRIESDGRFIDDKILEGSGMPAFDDAVRRAVTRCGQVSPPPQPLRNVLRHDGIEVVFQN